MNYLIKLENGLYHSHKEHTKRDGYPIGYIVSDKLPDFPINDSEHFAEWNGTSWDYINKDEYISKQNELIAIQNEEQERARLIFNAIEYLKSTDWVKDYKLRHDIGLELIPEESSKWYIINKRSEYIKYLKGIES